MGEDDPCLYCPHPREDHVGDAACCHSGDDDGWCSCNRFTAAPASPPPPTENARAGVDESDVNDQDREWAGILAVSPASMLPRLIANHRMMASDAGRARGIDEERKRCERIAREAIRWGGTSKLALQKCTAIADAIAKETL